MRQCVVLVCLAAFLQCSAADSLDPTLPLEHVEEVYAEDFDGKVLEGAWLVQFYAPWCSHCQELVPVWAKVAKELAAIDPERVKVAKFDVTQEQSGVIGDRYELDGFPTIVLLKNGGLFRFDHEHDTVGNILHFVEKALGTTTAPASHEPAMAIEVGTVTFLNARNAVSVIEDTTKDVFVKFYAPWCGHCKSMTKDYEELARMSTNPDVVIAKIDTAKHEDIGEKYQITSYPTLLV